MSRFHALAVVTGLLAAGVLGPACSSTTTSQASPDAGSATQGAGDGGGGTQCTAARDQLLVPVDKVSTGQVKVVSEAQGVTTIYVDASAGGFDQARKNPRVYITLAGARVDVTDKEAPSSPDWDLALKRAVLFTNSGDAGPAKGGGRMIKKPFDAVTAVDLDAAEIAPESFFDEACNAKKDAIQDVQTTFTGWYDYDITTNIPSPNKNVSFAVKNAAGVRYLVGIESYTAKPDGTTNSPGTGFFLLKVAQR